MPPKNPKTNALGPGGKKGVEKAKKKTRTQVLGLSTYDEVEELAREEEEEWLEEEIKEPPPPSKPLEGTEAPLVLLRQHGQRSPELQRLDMKSAGKIIRTVVDLKMVNQDKAEQRADGLEKTWNLERLEHLSLVHLNLTTIDPRIGNMTLLHTCDFSDNQLQDKSFPEEMKNCQKLRLLKINNNRLSSVPAVFGQLPSLQRMEAKNNRIHDIKGLNNCTKMESIDISYNRLLLFDVGISDGKNQLKSLQVINCSHNHITAIITDLALFPKLTDVNFSYNGLRSLNAGILQNTTLQTVNMKGNYIFKINIPENEKQERTKSKPVKVSQQPQSHFIDLSENRICNLPKIYLYFNDVDFQQNWIRYIPSNILKDLSAGRNLKEWDFSRNPLSCFRNIEEYRNSNFRLMRYLLEYDERLEKCLYRGMKIIVLGGADSGMTEFSEVLCGEFGLDFRQRIVEHNLRMRRWLSVYDYYLNALMSANDHRVVHCSLWQFSGTIRNATLDFVFIRHEQMLVNLVFNMFEFQSDFEYEILGLWIDMVMTYSSDACIIIPVGMFGEEMVNKDAEYLVLRVEKYLSNFLNAREKELKTLLDDLEAIGEPKLSIVANMKLQTLRKYKTRLPLIHENVVRIGPGLKGLEDYLNLVKAASFHPSFFGEYVKPITPNVLEVERAVQQVMCTMEVPMLRFSEFTTKFKSMCGNNEQGLMEVAKHLHSRGKIFWFGMGKQGDHADDIIFLNTQWFIDTLYSLLDRETVMQMAAQSKKIPPEEYGYEQCLGFLEWAVMSVDILKQLWKSVMPDYILKFDKFSQLIGTLVISYKIGFPIDKIEEHQPDELPKGRFSIDPNSFTAEWSEKGGKGDSKIEPKFYKIPYLLENKASNNVENHLKSLGLLDSNDAKKFPILSAEFYFPVFSPPGIWARSVSHIHQVIKTLTFVNIWKDGVWAKTTDGAYGVVILALQRDTKKSGCTPSIKTSLKFQIIDLNAKSVDDVNAYNKMWGIFTPILKEMESMLLWFPGLYYLSNSLCPFCRNAAWPSEWHDGRELAKTKNVKCKSCGKEIHTYFIVKTV